MHTEDITPTWYADRMNSVLNLREVLTHSEHHVAMILCSHMNAKGEAWMSVKTLAAESQRHPKTVRKLLAGIRRAGVFVKDGRLRGRYPIYVEGHVLSAPTFRPISDVSSRLDTNDFGSGVMIVDGEVLVDARVLVRAGPHTINAARAALSSVDRADKKKKRQRRRNRWINLKQERKTAMIESGLLLRCAHCSTWEDITIDHIVSLADGGSDDLDNLQFLCRPCNSKKG